MGGEFRIFLSTGKKVFCFDIRMAKQPKIIYQFDDANFFSFPSHSDEINSVYFFIIYFNLFFIIYYFILFIIFILFSYFYFIFLFLFLFYFIY